MIADRKRLQLIFLFAGLFVTTASSRARATDVCVREYHAVGAATTRSPRIVAPGVVKGQTRYQEQIWGLVDAGDPAKARALQNSLEKAMTTTKMTVVKVFGEAESAGSASEVVIGANTRGIMKAKAGDQGDPKVEVAAYLIDKQLEQNSVPVTILRTHEGRQVSVQASVTEANLLDETKSVRDRAQHENPPRLQFFDHLIANYDRTGGNYFVQGHRLVAIDNGAGFVIRTSTYIDNLKAAVKLPKDGAIAKLRELVPQRTVFEKLEATSEAQWRTILGPYLNAEQMQMFFEGRIETINEVRAAQKILGDGIFR